MPVNLTVQYDGQFSDLAAKQLGKFATSLLQELGKSEYSVSVVLVGDQRIQELNNQYRHKNKPTNVLSFPFDINEEMDISQLQVKELGDIIISVDTALREALEYNQPFKDRMNWLVVHGMLHLVGYDHETSEQDAIEMFEKEKQLLAKLKNRRTRMANLAINVDHVATIREARGIMEPDPVTAAGICELAGASGIVVHLREDRRHIQDRDIYLLRETIKTKLNLEMGANKEIIDIALDVQPDMVTLVPEKRKELTTEGGLDVLSQMKKLTKTIKRFDKENIPVSLFIDPDINQLKAAHEAGATFVELHTGRYSDALSEDLQASEFALIGEAAEEAVNLGLRVNAGHGLNYHNTAAIASLDSIEELSIGHAIIAHAVFVGLERAVKEMLAIVNRAELAI